MLEVTATAEDGVIMGAMHKHHPVHGVQFHPESIASEHGHLILKNFLDIAAAWNAKHRAGEVGRVMAARSAAMIAALAPPSS